MPQNKSLDLSLSSVLETSNTEEYDIPLNITDLLVICQEFTLLHHNLQQQIENILEIGLTEAIECGIVKVDKLFQIKRFLERICENPYFGDATFQAQECIDQIGKYQITNPKYN